MMVCGLVPTARLAAAVAFLFSLSSLFFLFHTGCNTPPGYWLINYSGHTCTLLRSFLSLEDGRAVLLEELNLSTRPSTNYRRNFGALRSFDTPQISATIERKAPVHIVNTPTSFPIKTQATTLSEVGTVTHLSSPPQTARTTGPQSSHTTPSFHNRAHPNTAQEATNPAGVAPPGQNKVLDDKKDPHDKGGKKDSSGENDPPTTTSTVETSSSTVIQTVTTTSSSITSGTENTVPPVAITTPPPTHPAESSPAQPIVPNPNTGSTGNGSPPAAPNSPFTSQTLQNGGGPAASASSRAAGASAPVVTFPGTSNPASTPLSSMLSLPDFTTSLSSSYASFSPQSSSDPTAFPTVASSENLSRNIRHTNLAIILGVLIPLIAVASVVVAFIFLRRRISRMRRERDEEEVNTFSPTTLQDPFEVQEIGRSDMLNMFRVSGRTRTPDHSILSTLPEEEDSDSSQGHGGPPSSVQTPPDRHSVAPSDPTEKGEQPEPRDSRYSDSDTSWIWYRPPMAI